MKTKKYILHITVNTLEMKGRKKQKEAENEDMCVFSHEKTLT